MALGRVGSLALLGLLLGRLLARGLLGLGLPAGRLLLGLLLRLGFRVGLLLRLPFGLLLGVGRRLFLLRLADQGFRPRLHVVQVGEVGRIILAREILGVGQRVGRRGRVVVLQPGQSLLVLGPFAFRGPRHLGGQFLRLRLDRFGGLVGSGRGTLSVDGSDFDRQPLGVGRRAVVLPHPPGVGGA